MKRGRDTENEQPNKDLACPAVIPSLFVLAANAVQRPVHYLLRQEYDWGMENRHLATLQDVWLRSEHNFDEDCKGTVHKKQPCQNHRWYGCCQDVEFDPGRLGLDGSDHSVAALGERVKQGQYSGSIWDVAVDKIGAILRLEDIAFPESWFEITMSQEEVDQLLSNTAPLDRKYKVKGRMPIHSDQTNGRYGFISWHAGNANKCVCWAKIHHFSATAAMLLKKIVFTITCAECPVLRINAPMTRQWLVGVYKYMQTGKDEDYEQIMVYK